MKKKASIIIPIYNNVDEIKLSLDSIANQTIDKRLIEVIIVDDGSDIKVRDIIREYEHCFEISMFWQEDKGFRPGNARNLGIINAVGDICIFIDSGVVLASDCIQTHIDSHYCENVVVIGYVYANSADINVEETKRIIEKNDVDTAILEFEKRGIFDRREQLYRELGRNLDEWEAPWIVLWSLHFSVSNEFIRRNSIYFDKFFTTWGGEDNEYGIQLFNAKAHFVLGETAKAFHYPHKRRDGVIENYSVNFQNNKQYIAEKYKGDLYVQSWAKYGLNFVKNMMLNNRNR